MSIVATSTDTYSQDVLKEGVTVIDFWAEWCGPCKMFAPVFEASSVNNPEIAHLKVDVDEHPDLAMQYGVLAIPTTVILKDAQTFSVTPGAMNAKKLNELLAQAAA